MAIYIEIVKLDDAGEEVVYGFGESKGIVGQMAINKKTGIVTLIQIAPEAADREAFLVPRVARVLFRCFDDGEFPDRTCYAA